MEESEAGFEANDVNSGIYAAYRTKCYHQPLNLIAYMVSLEALISSGTTGKGPLSSSVLAGSPNLGQPSLGCHLARTLTWRCA